MMVRAEYIIRDSATFIFVTRQRQIENQVRRLLLLVLSICLGTETYFRCILFALENAGKSV